MNPGEALSLEDSDIEGPHSLWRRDQHILGFCGLQNEFDQANLRGSLQARILWGSGGIHDP
jgi:hypothetical protein